MAPKAGILLCSGQQMLPLCLVRSPQGLETSARASRPASPVLSLQGPFDRDGCASKHSINPYSNRESRVLFSTWNLDHV